MQRPPLYDRFPHLLITIALLLGSVTLIRAQATLELDNGDHVTIVGNGLAERMNLHGYFETRLHTRFPEMNLVIRNLGHAGDVVEEDRNLFVTDGPDYSRKSKQEVKRARNWTSRERWISMLDTDVLLVMYGFNESFRGPEKVEAFRKHLRQFVKTAKNKKHDESTTPRVALVSPVAFEDLDDPDLPDGTSQNQNLEAYTDAIKAVAKDQKVPFVDLFSPTKECYKSDDKNWTFNGAHLSEYGYRRLSEILDRKLFGQRSSSFPHDRERLRQAILDKNEYWFDWYRINDATNVYGRRSHLSYKPNKDISNWNVYRREQNILRQMVKNRDKKIWALANGEQYTVTDDNLPEHIEVKTNAPGDNPDGSYSFLGGKEAIKKMDVREGFEVNLFASEEMFPELINPVQMAFDTKGRLWVSAWEGYPNYEPPGEKRDELIILEDTDDDGVADERTIFADELKNPTGFNFWYGGVLVTQAPYVTFLKDTDGDSKADVRRRMLSHISSADTHHTLNSYSWGPGGALFFSEGVFHRTQVETPYGVRKNRNGTVWRFEPDAFQFQRYNTFPGSQHGNLHGHAITRWNQHVVYDASPAKPFHATLFSGYLPFPKNHPDAPMLYDKRTRPEAAATIVSSGHFPEHMQGDLLKANVIGLQGIQQFKVSRDGASFQGNEIEPLITSSDPNFRPVAMAFGPDGALYFADWQNPLIGHMQHHIRDPNRDQSHGRVYRITYKDRPLTDEKKIDGQPIPELLDLLKEHDGHVRTRAKIELDARNSEKVVAATDQWLKKLDPDATAYTHYVLEGLWVHQWHNEVDVPLLKRVLNFDDPRARAAAVRVIGYWRDEVDGALDLMEQAVNDPDPLVRLEAVRALSFFHGKRAMSIALQSLQHEMDTYLEYTLNQTSRALKPYWLGAFESGTKVVDDNYSGLSYLVDRLPEGKDVSKLLLDQPSTPAVNRALLQRPDISLARRKKAIRALADAAGVKPVEVLLDYLEESGDAASNTELVSLLEELDRDQLAPRADRLEQLAWDTSSAGVRRTAFIALATIDQDVDRLKPIASTSVQHAKPFLAALRNIGSEAVRSSAYPFVRSLLLDPSEVIEGGSERDNVFEVWYYGSNPPDATRSSFEAMAPQTHLFTDRITTDLEPVQSGGDTFALKYRATMELDQSGTYAFHLTSDDGSRLFVDGDKIINNDGAHGPEEKTGTVTLDAGEHELLITQFDEGGGQALSLTWTPPGAQDASPVPNEVFRPRVRSLQKAALELLAELPVSPRRRFTDLVQAMDHQIHVLTAAKAAQRLVNEVDQVSFDDARKAVMGIGKHVETLSATRRSEQAVKDVLQFGMSLTESMSSDDASDLKKPLSGLAVRLVTIETVPGQMRYDTESVTAHPGETIAIQLVNEDELPHNLVITGPGAYEVVGKASMNQEDGARHDYVPQRDQVENKIITHTSLLNSGESERLIFKVPEKTDDYPYVCTFPGHWRTMRGVIHVQK